MTKLDLHSSKETSSTASTDTEELAWELQQKRPDTHRVQWLLEMGADVPAAIKIAGLKAADLLKNPALRPYLQKHLH